MAKNLRAIVVKGGRKPVRPEWAKSTHSSAYLKKHMPEQKNKLDRGANHEPNFTAQIVPVYNREKDRMGYNADTSETIDSMDPFSDQNSDLQQGRVAEGQVDEMITGPPKGPSMRDRFNTWRQKNAEKTAQTPMPSNLTQRASTPRKGSPLQHPDVRPGKRTSWTTAKDNDPDIDMLGKKRNEQVEELIDDLLAEGYSLELVEAMFEMPEFIEEIQAMFEAQELEEDATSSPAAMAKAVKRSPFYKQKITIGSKRGLKLESHTPGQAAKAEVEHKQAALKHGSFTKIDPDKKEFGAKQTERHLFTRHRQAEKKARKIAGGKDSLA